jgi:hypothetical protein
MTTLLTVPRATSLAAVALPAAIAMLPVIAPGDNRAQAGPPPGNAQAKVISNAADP